MALRSRKRKSSSRRTKKVRKPAKARKRTPKRTKRRNVNPKRRAARKPAARPATRKGLRKAAPKRAAAAVAPAPAAPAADGLAAAVEAALRSRGYDAPDPVVVTVLTAIGTGYRQGPANPPAWIRVDVDGPIADGIVERFATGDRASDVDRTMHRSIVRNTVDFNLDQLPGGTETGDPERTAIASFCLGSWDPAMDANAERNGIASFVVPWYLAGRA